MAKELPLTLAFLHQKPLAAGRELATMGAEEAAIFLDAIPSRFAAPTLMAMGAWSASQVLSKMSESSATAILHIIDYLDAAAILRNFSINDRARLLSGLPEKLRRDFEISLAFPDGTVGAHMTTAFMALTEKHVVGDAIDLIKHSATDNQEMIVIVDTNHKLTGAVTASSLLRHSDNTTLGKIMDRGVIAVSARSRLSAIDTASGWSHYTALPVTSRQKHVIGLLHRKAVTSVCDLHKPSQSQATESISLSMLNAFIASTLGLTHALIGAESSTAIKKGSKK